MIPDENLIWIPEQLMTAVLAHTHYLPVTWRGQAHQSRVRDNFGQFFQLRAIYLFNELLSPITTPFILFFCLRPRALDLVDFFRNFTVSVVGVGDVCSFAQMDVRKHGNPDWQLTRSVTGGLAPEVVTPVCETNQYTQGEHGKTELSLVHFTLTNPEWKMPVEAKHFVRGIRQHAMQDVNQGGRTAISTAMEQSMFSMESIQEECIKQKLFGSHMAMSAFPVNSAYGQRNPFSQDEDTNAPLRSTLLTDIQEDEQSADVSAGVGSVRFVGPFERNAQSVLGTSMSSSMRGGLSKHEGPAHTSQDGLLSSVYGAGTNDALIPTDLTAADMCLSTLYLHELHHRQIRRRGQHLEQSHRQLWQSPHQQHQPQSTSTPGIGHLFGAGASSASGPSTSSAAAGTQLAERTPLLGAKKS